MTKKLTLFILIFLGFIFPAKSQNTDTTNAIINAVKKSIPNVGMEIKAKYIEDKNTFTIKTKQIKKQNSIAGADIYGNKLNRWSVGMSFGITQFFGDIKQYEWYPSKTDGFFELKSALSIQVNRSLNSIFNLQTEFITGKFAGLRRKNEGVQFASFDPYGFYEGNGEKFIADFKEFDLNLTINLTNLAVSYTKNYKERRFSYFLKFGIGYNTFHSVKRNLFSDKYIYSYGYADEGEFGGLIKKDFLSTSSETVFIKGIILKYLINNKLDVFTDITVRTGRTDKWDSTIEELNSTIKNDHFAFYSFGLIYHIGKQKKVMDWYSPIDEMYKTFNDVHANIEGLTIDSDNDGVSDAFDKSTNTPLGVAVDGSGKPLDVDMDNVPDYMDEDPFSTRGAIVDKNGKELDTDKDGIPDSKDLEMNTEKGSMVNRFGISINGKDGKDGEKTISDVYFPSVYFNSASSLVTESNFVRTAIVAQVLLSNPNLRLKVVGNTDEIGLEEFNLKLGRERAQEVVNHFRKVYGISSDRFSVSTKGESNPLAIGKDNTFTTDNMILKEDYHQINRRVDFEIIE
ncbi:MAG: OmpA family protein [Flavobacteriales bacterium]|nr:OmpA family protein [Flavobacteriales bacterium]